MALTLVELIPSAWDQWRTFQLLLASDFMLV